MEALPTSREEKTSEIQPLNDETKSRATMQLNNSPVNIYHERQSKQLCALHALNNLFQSPLAFKKQDLDAICKELAPNSRIFNPHRSALGLGCYDINVIIAALSKKGYDVIWFDKRKDLSCLNLDRIFGLILNVANVPSNGLFALPLNYLPIAQKHWITLRKVGSNYYNLDSKLESPGFIGGDEALIDYLKFENSMVQFETFVVVLKTVSEDQSWKK